MNCYLSDILTGTTLNLSTATATQPFIVSDNGFTPATAGLDGGRETINLYATATMPVLEAAFSTLESWLNTAASYYAAGEHRIYFYVTQLNATYTRRALVKGGQVRKTDWKERCDVATATYYMAVQLTLERECVELSEAFTLRNLVVNPSFEYDTNGDNIPDNWTPVGGAALNWALSASAPHGRRITGLLNNAAVAQANSDNITVVASTDYECIAYGACMAGQVLTITVYDVTHAADIDHFHIAGVGATPLVRGYMKFSTPAGCVSINVRIEGPQSLSCFFDCIYIGLSNTYGGASIDHGMWSDYYIVNGHDDWEWDNATGAPSLVWTDQSSAHHEILDVLEIQGDVPADVRVKAHEATGINFHNPRLAFMALYKASRTFLSLQAENATVNAAPTIRTDAGASGPAGSNCYELPLVAGAQWYLQWYIAENDALRLAGKVVRVYAVIGNAPSIGATYTVQWGISPTSSAPSEYYTTPTLANNASVYWWLCPGPTFRFPQSMPWRPGGTDILQAYLYFWAYQAAGYNCYVDRIILVPAEGYLECVEGTVVASTADDMYAADDKYWRMDNASGELTISYPQSIGKMAVDSVEQLRIWFSPRHGDYGGTPAVDTSTTLYIRWRYSAF